MVNVWYTMVYLFQNTMVFYHGFPVSKRHAIYYGIRWYIFTREAPGPDGLHSLVLKECSTSLTKPVYWIFQQLLHTRQVPPDWKQATVTHIFKKGSRLKDGNYRPVSLTSITMEFQNKHNIINPNQHGFLEGKSCLTNLLENVKELTSVLDDDHGLDVITWTEFDTWHLSYAR